jgi:hypothetical protein
VSLHTARHDLDEPWTYEALIELWRSYDEPVASAELERLWPPATLPIVWLARLVLAAVVVTVLVGLPPLLRVVGS